MAPFGLRRHRTSPRSFTPVASAEKAKVDNEDRDDTVHPDHDVPGVRCTTSSRLGGSWSCTCACASRSTLHVSFAGCWRLSSCRFTYTWLVAVAKAGCGVAGGWLRFTRRWWRRERSDCSDNGYWTATTPGNVTPTREHKVPEAVPERQPATSAVMPAGDTLCRHWGRGYRDKAVAVLVLLVGIGWILVGSVRKSAVCTRVPSDEGQAECRWVDRWMGVDVAEHQSLPRCYGDGAEEKAIATTLLMFFWTRTADGLSCRVLCPTDSTVSGTM
ncbi:hypothetical protein GGTG_13060 [Gaeumannomyces tritici R3-111a-1]|uniref:Uncharacterized protein n=1 Tax=Gaeumannomyces tritici (strain R3-111a-1) TaxID=644352 RepID=J3PHS9_GAET3|nr:hypothetical protein GGTG_13060 [Gaeumannomyces tritici R3-111a-1]EJT69441.1 hypothetical protein GGTG_13060 [Gaeumannomyces tritici R3-111a-1]